MYGVEMPRLWSETIAGHRATVRSTILDTAWRLVSERGLASLTMSEIAEQAGIGRATLYKYFPDTEAILLAWHEEQVGRHLEQLAAIRTATPDPVDGLKAVLTAYARIARHRGGHPDDLAGFLHRGSSLESAQLHLMTLVADLIAAAVAVGAVRGDADPTQLASYALHALAAAADTPDEDAMRQLVDVVLAGLRPAD
jgi:AcrR family transcriptional regulator